MVTSLKISVVTVSSPFMVVFQRVFINAADDARSCARRFEEDNADLVCKLDWVVTVLDY